jgi:translation initiation factor 5
VKKELAKEIIRLCAPILTWLKEAEEESEESDEEELDIDFDDRSRQMGTIVEKKPVVNGKSAISAENGEEVDIDDI